PAVYLRLAEGGRLPGAVRARVGASGRRGSRRTRYQRRRLALARLRGAAQDPPYGPGLSRDVSAFVRAHLRARVLPALGSGVLLRPGGDGEHGRVQVRGLPAPRLRGDAARRLVLRPPAGWPPRPRDGDPAPRARRDPRGPHACRGGRRRGPT